MDPDDEAADTSSAPQQQLQRPLPPSVAMTPEDGPAADPPPPALDWPAMADAKPPQVPPSNYMTTPFDVVTPNKLPSPSQVPSSSSASLLVPGRVVETSSQVPSSRQQQQQQQVPNSPDVDCSSSDVENFTGKIVYNPDGSAFLLDDSESDSEAEPPGGLATMVSALHVAASPALYSALYGAPYHLPLPSDSRKAAESAANKVPEFPVVHSFRVFTVRDIADDNKEDAPSSSNSNKVPNSSTNTTTNSSTVAVSATDYSSNKFPSSCATDYSSSTGFPSSTAASPAGRCSTGLLGAESATKPILMCFLCKLSFGYSKSFVSHAVGEHAIALNDEEKALMGVKGASAIIQGVGRDKTPTLSFLEPLAGPSPPGTHPVTATQPPATAMTTLVSSVSSPVPCPKTTSSSGPPGGDQDFAPEMQDLMTIERLARAAVAASRAAASQQQNGVLDTSRPSSRDSGATPPRRPSSPPCSCGGECPRCLGSSDPLMPMSSRAAMSHSRNSCKTLKCPKCNWHYKYQETLEIHMKEKHPENELSCAYCLTNQSHPRLARGETYTCGYKPYRCEVCNYSTTTKGNLSIHMQSDKHINNVQELQNGGGAAMAPSATPPLGPTPPLVDPTPPSSKKPLPMGGPSPKPKATWRCDVCNYETNVARNLRIHMTSEKHNHNMMVLQQNVKHMQTLSAFQQMEPLFPFHPPGFLLPPPPPPPPPSCEGGQGQQVAPLQPEAALADMAYNHALLMMASQQQQHHEHQQHNQRAAAALALAAAQQAAVLSSKFSQQQQQQEFAPEEPPVVRPDVPFDERHGRLFQCCVCHVYSCDTVEALSAHCQMDRTRQREEEVLMIVAGTYICKLCTYKTNLKANFQLHCKTDKHLQRLQHVNHVKEGGAATEWKLQFCASGLTSASVQVRCNACDHSTNSAHKLQLHASGPQHAAAARLFQWLAARQSGTADSFFQCKGCGGFATKRKLAMIQHARSPRHARRCQGREDEELIVVRELTGNENIIFDADVDTPMLDLSDDIKMEDTKPSPPPASPASDSSRLKKALLTEPKAEPADSAQHRCPFCPFSCSGEVQLQMHVMSQHAVPCPLCQEGCRGTEALEEHLIQVHNVIKEGVQRLLLMVDLATDAATSTKSSSKSSPSPSNPPKEEGTSPSLSKTQHPQTTTEEPPEESKPQQQVVFNDEDLSCTFCNKGFSTPEELFSHQSEHGHMELRPTPTGLEYQCWWRRGQCDRTFRTPTAAQTHFKEAHLDSAVKMTQPSTQGQSHNQLLREAQDCSSTLKGSQQNQQQVAVSDRHVYRYRCNQCSLAFKTLEKLQLHSQYHLIRAATKCPLCGRSFRSVVALQKHVEATHADMSREQMERYQSSLATNPLLSAGGPLGGVLDPSTTELLRKESARAGEIEEDLMMDMDGIESDPGSNQQQQQDVLEDYINSQSMAEDSYNDPNRKYKCHRCKVAFTRQSYLTSHNKTLLHRKGEKMSYPMEKYLDPNRPFKCDVCLESFTQKNILLVHYNSVSHLHKVKLSMKETSSSSAPRSSSPLPSPTSSTPPTTEEKKPFKCNICKVSYTQASTLDIHVRSVLHQTRASKLHELAASGQIDLTAPLIERAPETPTTPEANIANDSSSTTVPSENVPQSTAAPSSDSVPTVSTSPAPIVPTSQQQNNTSTAPTSSMMSLPSLSPAESLLLQQPLLPELMAQSHQQQRPRCPFPRPRPLVYKRLVESFGFDVVMHFNENNHRRKKIKTEEPESSEGQKNEESVTELPDSTTSPDLPEINKSVCDLCSKEFSCIWVLKTHREEIHKEMVPFDFLLKFSETYRVLYDKQSTDTGSALVVTPDDLDPPSTPSSEISPTPSSVASSNQPIPTPPTVVPQPPVESAASVTANQMAQLQFNQLLMSMGLGLGGPMGVNFMPPPLIPVLLPPPMDHPLMAFNHPAAMMGDPGSYFAAAAAAAAAAQQQQQQKLLQQQQQSVAAQQQKRARTRINDEQLKILRAYFDINNSPSEEQLVEMSDKSGLPLKVIKHWFRNTLFKERQRNKDSPYNFNNPPSTFLNLEEYEKTGEAKVVPLHNSNYADSTNQSEDPEEDTEDSCIEHHHEKIEKPDHSTKNKTPPKEEPLFNHHIRSESSSPPSSTNLNFGSPTSDSSPRGVTSFASPSHSLPQAITTTSSNNPITTNNGGVANTSSPSLMFPLSLATGNSPSYVGGIASGSTASSTSPSYTVSMATNSPSFGVGVTSGNNASNPSPSLGGNNNPTNLSVNSPSYGMGVTSGSGGTNCNQSYSNNNPSPSYGNPSASSPSYSMGGANNSPSYVSSSPSPYGGSGGNQSSYSGGGASGSSSGGKRANRTRFTDYQIKVLQEFFESNAYPKDDDLEYLSKLLSLSPRVIVVWFQNARQKARKVYENRPPPDVTDHVTADDDSSKTSTGNLNYQCKKCLQSFQRYYELIKHQKNACFKDENPLAAMQLNNKVEADKPPQQNNNGTYRCDKCSLSFSRFDQWREHQIVHIMNPGIFPAQHFAANSSFGILQFEAQQPPTPPLAGTPTSALATPPLKRKASEEEELQLNKVMGGTVINDDSSQPKDKRLRTTILPEQLDYLYQKYQVESNPSRKMLENIAREVGLKKRVVQVWFQNTRARERKGQFRAHQQVIHKRCPFCRALFKARSALESHLATRHADQYTRGDINIDSLPDGEMDSNPETPTSSSEDCKSLYTGAAGLANALGSQGNMGTTSQPDLNTMKKYYEDSLKKYLDDLSFLPSTPKEQPESSKQLNSGPLDLSKPQPPTRAPSMDEKSNHSIQDDAKSETYSESTMDMTDEGMVSSDPASPSGSSHHHGQSQGMGGAKRFRTQMSTVQLKVMKSVFADYKTPSMAECETLGREIGLPKRVVQVWFQNARAKEKKARLAFLKAFGHEMDPPKPPEECTVCKVKYNSKFSSTSMQDHMFSRRHLDALKAHITKMKKLTEGQQSQHDQEGGAGDEDPPNLMQQLHMMGLPAALPPAPPNMLSPSNKDQQQQQQEDNKEQPRKEDSTTNATKEDSAAPTTSEANNHLFPYMYGFPGYYAGLSGAFFHPGIFPGRNKL